MTNLGITCWGTLKQLELLLQHTHLRWVWSAAQGKKNLVKQFLFLPKEKLQICIFRKDIILRPTSKDTPSRKKCQMCGLAVKVNYHNTRTVHWWAHHPHTSLLHSCCFISLSFHWITHVYSNSCPRAKPLTTATTTNILSFSSSPPVSQPPPLFSRSAACYCLLMELDGCFPVKEIQLVSPT